MPTVREGSPNDPVYEAYLECVAGSSNKFWAVRIYREKNKRSLIAYVNWGRIGTNGQATSYRYGNTGEALSFAERKVNEKLGRGYRRVDSRRMGMAIESSDWRLRPPRRTLADTKPAPRRNMPILISPRPGPNPGPKIVPRPKLAKDVPRDDLQPRRRSIAFEDDDE